MNGARLGQSLVAAAEVEARRLVRANSVAVEHLAEALERFKAISGYEVRAILAEGMARQSMVDHGWIGRAFRTDYNGVRPHSPLEDLSPARFAANWLSEGSRKAKFLNPDLA